MNLCEFTEYDVPVICSYEAEITRQNAAQRKIDRILDHHLFDVDAALESGLRAWEVWERVNAGK